jgi:hypothetical protein
MHPSELPQNFFDQLTLESVSNPMPLNATSFAVEEPHEVFLFSLHPAWLVIILPQESAVVSNTLSKRNEGFLYSFLRFGSSLFCNCGSR